MSEIDYEELIRSPLDDIDQGTDDGWGLVIAGIAAGAVVALGLSLVVGGEEPIAVETTTTTSAVATVAPVVAADYPPGYIEIAPEVAANSGEIIVDGESVVVAFTSAVIRGSDPLSTPWPLGGVWALESTSGAIAESERVVIGRFSPAAFTVQFPAAPFNGATDFASVRMIERWDQEKFNGSLTVPFSGEPFIAPEPLTIPVSQDVTLIVQTLRLGRFLGSVQWTTNGTPLGAVVDIEVILLDGDGDQVGSYARFPGFVEPSSSGGSEIFWGQPFPTDQEGAESAVVQYTVIVPEVAPASVEFDLADVPIGR